VTLVEKLVSCYSPSGNERKAIELFIKELKRQGFQAYQDEVGNGIGTIGQGEKNVYMIGHIDTVIGEIPVRVVDGKLYGRGSVDAKGSLAVFVEAAAKFLNSKQLNLTVIGCVNEENDSAGASFILDHFDPPDYVIIGEPSGWDALTLGYKGSMWMNYSLKKPKTHQGSPELMVAEEAISFYQALCSEYSNQGKGFKDITFRLSDLNTTSSEFQESVQMKINVRIPPRFELKGFRTILKKLQGDASITLNGYIPAIVADKHNQLVRAFLGGIREQEASPGFKYKTGTSDMNLFYKWDKPILAYGPGDSSLDHTPNEHLNLEEYQWAITVLCSVLKRLEREENGS